MEEMKGFVIEKTPEHTRQYADAMIEIANELNITVFNVFELTSKEEHFDKAFIDGLHFSAYGGNLISQLIKDEVEKRVEKFRGLSLENFPTYSGY